MQDRREADQAEEQQIAQEQTHAEGHLEARVLRVLHRPIRELPTLQPTITLERSATVRDAIMAMQQAQMSCVLVVDQGQLVGSFTERDVVTRVVAQEIDVDHVQMQEVMHSHPDSLGMEDELVYALHQMSLGEYRPLPVVDDQRRPVALVSMQDIVGYLLACLPHEGFNFPPSPAHRIAPARDGA
jgi:CBS domain-containing protein